MDKESAEKLSILMMQISAKMNESVAFVRDHDTEGLFENYKRIAGEVMGVIYIDIEEKLWQKHPELRPRQMDGPYEVDPGIFQPRFYEWDQ
jgi:hypothetical protein